MNPFEADLLPLPNEFRNYRDEFRVIGYELVHFTRCFAQSKANRVKHPVIDYEYAIHKIEVIDDQGQLHIDPNPFFTSAAGIHNWLKYYQDKEKPVGLGIFKGIFRDPALALVTIVALPYGLSLVGLAAIGDRANAKRQRERRQKLSTYAELPLFVRSYPRSTA
jgi:hypothetical protein